MLDWLGAKAQAYWRVKEEADAHQQEGTARAKAAMVHVDAPPTEDVPSHAPKPCHPPSRQGRQQRPRASPMSPAGPRRRLGRRTRARDQGPLWTRRPWRRGLRQRLWSRCEGFWRHKQGGGGNMRFAFFRIFRIFFRIFWAGPLG